MNKSEFPFRDDMEIAPDIQKGSFTKEFYLDKNNEFIIKEYDAVHAREINTSFKKMSDTSMKKYLPDPQVIIGKNNQNTEKAFLIMNFVDGQPFKDLNNLSEQQVTQLDSFIIDCFEYAKSTGEFPDILDVYNKLGREIIEFDNIIWGKTKEDSNEKLYLVDVWPTKSVEWLGMNFFKERTLSAISYLEKHTGQEICPLTKDYLGNI